MRMLFFGFVSYIVTKFRMFGTIDVVNALCLIAMLYYSVLTSELIMQRCHERLKGYPMPWRDIALFRLAETKHPLGMHLEVVRKRCIENECHRLLRHGNCTAELQNS